MNHLQVSGEHWDIGFQWGSLLAQRGILIWERIPFLQRVKYVPDYERSQSQAWFVKQQQFRAGHKRP